MLFRKWLQRIVAMALALSMVPGCGGDEVREGEETDEPILVVPQTVEMTAQVEEETETTMTVANDGSAVLEVDFEIVDADWLRVAPESMNVEADSTEDANLTGTCPAEVGEYTTELQIESNDPNLGEALVAITLNCEAADAGELTVEFTGLPTGVDGFATLLGPDDFQLEIEGSQSVSGLAPGDYELATADVIVEPATYTADDHSLEIVSNEETTVAVEYMAIPGELNVEISGLPDGVDAAVAVEGPGQFETTLTATELLSGLVPGDYYVTPDDVVVGPATYRASAQTIEVGSHGVENVYVEYELALGDLEVQITGLPQDVDAHVVVEGPDQFEAILESTTTLADLVPGDYDITAYDVEDGPATYTAGSESVEVVSDDLAVVDIEYEVILGDLEVEVLGLPTGVSASIELVAPDGTTTALPADGEVTDLEPGLYTLIPEEITDGGTTYLASEVDVTIASAETAQATIEYLVDPGSLFVTVNGLPTGANHDIDLVAEDGSTISVPQSGEMIAVEPGDYVLSPNDVTVGPATYTAPAVDVVIVSDEEMTATIDYEVIPAQWEIVIDGLPSGLDGDVDVVGGQLNTTITATTSFDDLYPDTYVVTPHDVTEGLATYEADEVSVVVESGANPALTITYAAVPGNLSVIISGLSGLDADVDIIDEDGVVVANVTETQIVADLEPGTYEVVPADVEDGLAIYRADATTADVLSDTTTSAEIEYELIYGQLQIDATGLDGLALEAEVEGPNYSETITGPQTLTDLEPGDYTVTFFDVEDGPAIYRASPNSIEVPVASDGSPEVIGEYELLLGDLALVIDFPEEMEFDVNLRDDEGTILFTRLVDGQGATTFADLVPGTYSVDPVGTLEDDNQNEYVDTSGFGTEIVVQSEQTATHTIAGTLPTLVTTGDDDGLHSLREVVSRVNADSTITFAEEVEAITLTSGQIEIERPLTIVGNSGRTPEIWVDASSRAFYVHEFADEEDEAVFAQLTIGGGTASGTESAGDGGAIYSESDLLLYYVELHDNHADGHGGAVFAEAILRVVAGIFVDNHANETAGAILANGFNGDLVLFADNTTDGFGGAMYIYSGGLIHEAVFARNTAAVSGGAIYVGDTLNFMEIERALFMDNEADSNGGALRLAGGDTNVSNSTFDANTATNGGAISVTAGADASISHVTMVANTASGDGPAIDVWENDEGTVWLNNSFVADNGTADTEIYALGSPVVSQDYNFVSRVTDLDFDDAANDITGTPLAALDGQYGTLAYHGGFPPTIDLESTSPGYHNIPEAQCVDSFGAAMTEDQRGFTRPVDGYCSRGAWEVVSNMETFDNSDFHDSFYQDGNFTGVNGITWYYSQARSEGDYEIEGKGVMFRDPDGAIWANQIPGGVDSFSVQYRKAFTGQNPRQFEVRVNGDVVYTSDVFGDFSGASSTVHTAEIDGLGISGDFDLEIRNLAPSGNAQITFDNIRWE